MDNKIVFLDIVIFLTFLALIFSNVFLNGIIIDPIVILTLLLVYIIAYYFIYKFGNFQKLLFILSICSFVFFMPLFGYWSFNSYVPLLIILNWYIIWMIFKNGRGSNDNYLGVNQFVLLAFIFYLVFSLVLIISPYSDFAIMGGTVIFDVELSIQGIIGIFSLLLSVILTLIFIATIVYNKYSSVSHDEMDRFER